jgi:hypothetical protein
LEQQQGNDSQGEIMNNHTSPRTIVASAVLALVFVVTLAFATSAGGTGTGDTVRIAKLERKVAALQKSRTALERRIHVVGVTSRTAYIEWLGLHGVDAGFNATTGVSAVNVERFNNAVVVLRNQRWPAQLQADAALLADYLSQTVAANARSDRQAEKTALTKAHEQSHVLSPLVYAWVKTAR